MAENDIDESVEEVDLEDEGSAEEGGLEVKKIAGMSVSLIIKIAIGLVIVLVAAGVYFFFFTGEELPESEVVIEEMEKEMAMEEGSMTTDGDDMKMDEAPKFSDIMKGLSGYEEEATELEDIMESAGEGVIPEDMMREEGMSEEDVMTADEKAPVAQDETKLLKQQINDLKAQIERKNKIMENRESSLSSSLAVEQYIADPGDEFGSSQLMSDPNHEPAPEPNWGGFDRYEYKKKKP